jgi:hypothetical protein
MVGCPYETECPHRTKCRWLDVFPAHLTRSLSVVFVRFSAQGQAVDKDEWESLLKMAGTVAAEINRISFDFESSTEVDNGDDQRSRGGDDEFHPEQHGRHYRWKF